MGADGGTSTAYTTVASIFLNLENKGYLTMRRFGNVKVYKPKISNRPTSAIFYPAW